MLGLIVWASIIAIAVTFAINSPPPGIQETDIWLLENAVLAEGFSSRVYLSGTVTTIPLEKYQSLTETFQLQKVIVELDGTNYRIVIHYLGEAKEFTYHATKTYSHWMGVSFKTVQLEGSTLRYNVAYPLVGDVMNILGGLVAGALAYVFIVAKKRY